jgi:hypothetical protein
VPDIRERADWWNVSYRIPLVLNAHRITAGNSPRLHVATADQNKEMPAPLECGHTSISASSFKHRVFLISA